MPGNLREGRQALCAGFQSSDYKCASDAQVLSSLPASCLPTSYHHCSRRRVMKGHLVNHHLKWHRHNGSHSKAPSMSFGPFSLPAANTCTDLPGGFLWPLFPDLLIDAAGWNGQEIHASRSSPPPVTDGVGGYIHSKVGKFRCVSSTVFSRVPQGY